MSSEATWPGLLPSADLLFGEILKSEAGVAGDEAPFKEVGRLWRVALLPFCACIYGDCLAERD
jgi:hypothetical protein